MIVILAFAVLVCVTFAVGLVIGNAVILRWALFLWAVPTAIVAAPVLWFYLSSVLAQLNPAGVTTQAALVWAQFGGVVSWLLLTFSMIALAGLWTGYRMASNAETPA